MKMRALTQTLPWLALIASIHACAAPLHPSALPAWSSSDSWTETQGADDAFPADASSSLGLSPTRIAGVLSRLQPDSHKLRGSKEAGLYARLSPAVVLIVTEDGLGSGTVIAEDGHILTNWHVVKGYDTVGVIFKPSQEGSKPSKKNIQPAKVIQFDEVSDLALLKLNVVNKKLPDVDFGNLSALRVGDDVHAIGHPTGETWSYTRGIVSQVRQAYEWRTGDGRTHTADVIQTQTPINPGNSGGPLLMDDGLLIGINTFKTDGEGLNFAVSADEIRKFLVRDRNRVAKVEPKKCKAKASPKKNVTLDSIVYKETHYDIDCDGTTDAVMFTPLDKSKPLFVGLYKGRVLERIVYDYDRDGKWDESYYYKPGVDDPVAIGLHPNGKIEPTTIEPL